MLKNRNLNMIFHLGLSLAKRDISAMYRQTYLGYIWALLPPLVTSLTFIFLNLISVVQTSDESINYPIYIFTGTIFWQMFCDCVNSPVKSIIANKSMLTKIDFPREALLVEAALNTLFSLMIKLILLIFVFLIFDVGLTIFSFYALLPIVALFGLGFCIGISFVPLGAVYEDVQLGLPLILGVMIFFVPVLYVPPSTGAVSLIYSLNPISILLVSIRETLYGSEYTSITSVLIILSIIMIFLFPFLIKIYKTVLPHLIERMES